MIHSFLIRMAHLLESFLRVHYLWRAKLSVSLESNKKAATRGVYSDSIWITNISRFSGAVELLSNLGIAHSCVYVISTIIASISYVVVASLSLRFRLARMNSCQISLCAWWYVVYPFRSQIVVNLQQFCTDHISVK